MILLLESFVVSLCRPSFSMVIHLNFFININFFQYILQTTPAKDLHYLRDILLRTNRVFFLEVLHKRSILILILA